MEYTKLIADRYSVRAFRPDHLSDSEIAHILAAGHLAPTGCNNQPQRILVLNTDESADRLKACTRCHFNAPTAMLVCYNKDECWTRKYDGKTCGVADACIVATHLMLAAADIGVGSTWVMHFDPAAMRETFAIPADIEPVALLVMGHPAPDATPMALHTQYRPLDEVVVYESF